MYRKKVAVLTLPLTNNYGGILQAYALMTYLRRAGFDPTFIKLLPLPIRIKKRFKIIKKQCLKKMIYKGDSTGNPFTLKEYEKNQRLMAKYSNAFIKKYIQPQTLPIRGIQEWKQFDKSQFDIFIVGSDQVWRKDYASKYLDLFFLNFTPNNDVKKIAYAASFGTNERQFSKQEIKKYSHLLHSFDSVSVREDSAVKICKNEMNLLQVEHLIDPTLLFHKQDYLDLIANEQTLTPNGDLCVYMLDKTQEKEMIVSQVRKKLNLKPFLIGDPILDGDEKTVRKILPSTLQWLRGFADAEFVITDSFHGCVFSIIFEKPFLVIGNKNRGMARFNSLLEKFHLMDRLIVSTSKRVIDQIDYSVDWSYVNKILQSERAKSKYFLGRI